MQTFILVALILCTHSHTLDFIYFYPNDTIQSVSLTPPIPFKRNDNNIIQPLVPSYQKNLTIIVQYQNHSKSTSLPIALNITKYLTESQLHNTNFYIDIQQYCLTDAEIIGNLIGTFKSIAIFQFFFPQLQHLLPSYVKSYSIKKNFDFQYLDTTFPPETFYCIQSILSCNLFNKKIWPTSTSFNQPNYVDFYCSDDNLLCKSWPTLLILVTLIVPSILNKYAKLGLGLYLNSISFELPYQLSIDLSQGPQIGQDIMPQINFYVSIVILFILLAFLIHSVFTLVKINNNPETAETINIFCLLHIKPQKKTLPYLLYNDILILKNIMLAILIHQLQGHLQPQYIVLIIMDSMMLIFSIIVLPFVYTIQTIIRIMFWLSLTLLDILIIVQAIYFDEDEIEQWNNMSLGLTITMLGCLASAVIEQLLIVICFIYDYLQTRKRLMMDQKNLIIQQKLESKIAEEQARFAVPTNQQPNELTIVNNNNRQKQNHELSLIKDACNNSEFHTIQDIIHQTETQPRKPLNYIYTYEPEEYYSQLNQQLNDAISQPQQQLFNEGLNSAMRILQNDKITKADFLDLQTHFGYNLSYPLVKDMDKDQFMKLILLDKKLQDKMIEGIIQNEHTKIIELNKRRYWDFRSKVSQQLAVGYIRECIELTKQF